MKFSQANRLFSNAPKLPLIKQEEQAECGHACIAMISSYWGHEFDLPALKQAYASSARGVTLSAITKIFEDLGFSTRALRVPVEELKHVKTPAILHWNMNHFVVLKQVKKNHVVIYDPASGIKRCSYEALSQSFTGIVLEVEKAEHFQKIVQNKTLGLYDLVKLISGINKFVILLLFLSLAIEVLNLLHPLFTEYVTDEVIVSNNLSNLYTIAAGFIIIVLIHIFTDYIRGNMVIYLSNHLTEKFSSAVVKHILHLPLDFFTKRHKGDIQSKFMAIEEIQKKISTDFINTVLDGLMVIINLIVMFYYSVLLTTVILMTLSLFILIRLSSYAALKRQTALSLQTHAQAASSFLENLQGMLAIKCFLKENVRFNTWRNTYINSLNANIHIAKLNVIYTSANQFLFGIEHVIVVALGAKLVLANQFTAGMLIAFLSYRLALVNKASSFIHHLFEYKLINLQLNRLNDIILSQPEAISTGYGKVEQVKGELSLQNICFKYNPYESLILNNINLTIKPGEKVAIIGASGCGKSTLLKVMMGLLQPETGEIYIDDISLKEFGLKNYRQMTASVMQEDTLLTGSIIENIAFFDADIDLPRVYEAAKQAYAHDFISEMPMGYETLLGDMGSTLSGGQKQRLLLARALYKKPKILFLDEATSHLDVENERLINQALKAMDITQIIIAHRMETIQMADRIINLQSL